MKRGWTGPIAASLAAIGWLLAAVVSPASAQSATHHMERVANQRLGGTAYARLNGLGWDQCIQRCLDDVQCKAAEHFRGGGVIFGRNSQCKLFNSFGELRTSKLADVAFKRPGATPKRSPPVVGDAKQPGRPVTETRRNEVAEKAPEPKRYEYRAPADGTKGPTGGSGPPPAPPVVGAPAPAPAPVTKPAAAPTPPTRSIVKTAPGDDAAARTDYDVVPVFYGTDRNRRDIPNKRIGYGSDRAGRLEIGRAMVTVPKLHQVPKVERPWKVTIPYTSIVVYEEKEDPSKHFTIQELSTLSREQALALIRERLAASNAYKRQALVMVHGFNNGFDDALYRTAQVTYDLNFDGAAFLYSWPSGSGIGKYLYDRDSAQGAEPYLTEFLEFVLKETGADKVSLIAHSMGNQLLLPVLRHLKDRNPALAAKINQVILAAPDIDRDAFTYLAGEIRAVGRGRTMYASSNDVALQAAKRVSGQKPRAGDIPSDLGPAIVAGVDTIDVSSLGTDYLATNHSTYAERTALLRDIELVLKTGEQPPEKRFPLYQRITTDKGDFWRFPQ